MDASLLTPPPALLPMLASRERPVSTRSGLRPRRAVDTPATPVLPPVLSLSSPTATSDDVAIASVITHTAMSKHAAQKAAPSAVGGDVSVQASQYGSIASGMRGRSMSPPGAVRVASPTTVASAMMHKISSLPAHTRRELAALATYGGAAGRSASPVARVATDVLSSSPRASRTSAASSVGNFKRYSAASRAGRIGTRGSMSSVQRASSSGPRSTYGMRNAGVDPLLSTSSSASVLSASAPRPSRDDAASQGSDEYLDSASVTSAARPEWNSSFIHASTLGTGRFIKFANGEALPVKSLIDKRPRYDVLLDRVPIEETIAALLASNDSNVKARALRMQLEDAARLADMAARKQERDRIRAAYTFKLPATRMRAHGSTRSPSPLPGSNQRTAAASVVSPPAQPPRLNSPVPVQQRASTRRPGPSPKQPNVASSSSPVRVVRSLAASRSADSHITPLQAQAAATPAPAAQEKKTLIPMPTTPSEVVLTSPSSIFSVPASAAFEVSRPKAVPTTQPLPAVVTAPTAFDAHQTPAVRVATPRALRGALSPSSSSAAQDSSVPAVSAPPLASRPPTVISPIPSEVLDIVMSTRPGAVDAAKRPASTGQRFASEFFPPWDTSFSPPKVGSQESLIDSFVNAAALLASSGTLPAHVMAEITRTLAARDSPRPPAAARDTSATQDAAAVPVASPANESLQLPRQSFELEGVTSGDDAIMAALQSDSVFVPSAHGLVRDVATSVHAHPKPLQAVATHTSQDSHPDAHVSLSESIVSHHAAEQASTPARHHRPHAPEDVMQTLPRQSGEPQGNDAASRVSLHPDGVTSSSHLHLSDHDALRLATSFLTCIVDAITSAAQDSQGTAVTVRAAINDGDALQRARTFLASIVDSTVAAVVDREHATGAQAEARVSPSHHLKLLDANAAVHPVQGEAETSAQQDAAAHRSFGSASRHAPETVPSTVVDRDISVPLSDPASVAVTAHQPATPVGAEPDTAAVAHLEASASPTTTPQAEQKRADSELDPLQLQAQIAALHQERLQKFAAENAPHMQASLVAAWQRFGDEPARIWKTIEKRYPGATNRYASDIEMVAENRVAADMHARAQAVRFQVATVPVEQQVESAAPPPANQPSDGPLAMPSSSASEPSLREMDSTASANILAVSMNESLPVDSITMPVGDIVSALLRLPLPILPPVDACVVSVDTASYDSLAAASTATANASVVESEAAATKSRPYTAATMSDAPSSRARRASNDTRAASAPSSEVAGHVPHITLTTGVPSIPSLADAVTYLRMLTSSQLACLAYPARMRQPHPVLVIAYGVLCVLLNASTNWKSAVALACDPRLVDKLAYLSSVPPLDDDHANEAAGQASATAGTGLPLMARQESALNLYAAAGVLPMNPEGAVDAAAATNIVNGVPARPHLPPTAVAFPSLAVKPAMLSLARRLLNKRPDIRAEVRTLSLVITPREPRSATKDSFDTLTPTPSLSAVPAVLPFAAIIALLEWEVSYVMHMTVWQRVRNLKRHNR